MLLMFRCPNTKKLVSTHIDIDPMKIDSLPDRLTFSQCEFCRTVHGWRPKDTFLSDGAPTRFECAVLKV
jgi:hypothetical protein